MNTIIAEGAPNSDVRKVQENPATMLRLLHKREEALREVLRNVELFAKVDNMAGRIKEICIGGLD